MTRASWVALCAGLAVACADEADPRRDADGDGTIAEVDCDDSDPEAWISWTVYRDDDGDGWGDAATAQVHCIGSAAPPGFSAEAGDCAPDDGTRWRGVWAAFRDDDEDGHTVREDVTLCVGTSFPPPLLELGHGNDCADDDATRYRWVVLYRDLDGDGSGAGPRWIPCLGEALPEGWVILGGDPDDADPTVTRVREEAPSGLFD